MNRVRTTLLIGASVLLLAGVAAGQKRARPKTKPTPTAPAAVVSPAPAYAKRPVTINLKQGDSVKGNFLRADAETALVDVSSGRLTIKMSDVVSMIFDDDSETEARDTGETAKAATQSAPDSNLQASRKAYAALTKIADAAKIKLPYGQYGTLLIDVRQVVEESLLSIPDSALKIEITRAMETYTDAGLAWGAMQPNGRIPISSDPGATLMRKYDIRPGVNQLGQADYLEINATLKSIWAVAGARLNNVAVLLRQ